MKKSLFLILITLIALFPSCKKEKVDVPVNVTEEKTSGSHEKKSNFLEDFDLETEPYEQRLWGDNGFDIYLEGKFNFVELAREFLPSRYTVFFSYSYVDPSRGGTVLSHSLWDPIITSSYTPGYTNVATGLNTVITNGEVNIGTKWSVHAETQYVGTTVYTCKINVRRIV